MTATAESRLLQAFCEHGKLDSLDNPTKAALRLCNKQIKAFIDTTVTAGRVKTDSLDALIRCNWCLTDLCINEKWNETSPNALKVLPSALIVKFPLLERLSINNCSCLAALPANIGELSYLKEFQINSLTRLTALPPSFGQLSSLERLELCECSSLTLEGLAPMKHLTQLKSLDMNGDPIDNPLFSDWFFNSHFPLLQDLTLAEGLQSSLPASIGNFKHLTNLDLRYHHSPALPESISCLSMLQKLDICTAAELISLPDSFSKLTALEELRMSVDMQGIAPLQYLTGLTDLTIVASAEEDEEEVEDDIYYPDFVWNLTSLKTLTLFYGSHRSLPDAIGNLKNLESLEIHEFYKLEEIAESIGNLSCLTRLEISPGGSVERLPESIGNLVSLKSLKFYRFDVLQTLPDSIENLKSLEVLEIGSCGELFYLPESIGKLNSMTCLTVRYCGCIKGLPESIGNLHALKVLEVQNCNEIFSLPDSFADLILKKPYVDWSLTRVDFSGSKKFVASWKTMQALQLLKERRVYWESPY